MFPAKQGHKVSDSLFVRMAGAASDEKACEVQTCLKLRHIPYPGDWQPLSVPCEAVSTVQNVSLPTVRATQTQFHKQGQTQPQRYVAATTALGKEAYRMCHLVSLQHADELRWIATRVAVVGRQTQAGARRA